MFANCQLGGTDICARPDMIFTAAPPSPSPVPAPYPNVAQGATGVGFCPKVILCGGPAHNLATTVPVTQGATGPVVPTFGVISGTVMGPSRHTTSSAKVKWGGVPATRVTSKAMQNATNTSGTRAAPSQMKVVLLG